MAKTKFKRESVLFQNDDSAIHRISFKSGDLSISMNAEIINGKFIGITFPCIQKGSCIVEGTITWNGNGFTTIDMSNEDDAMLRESLSEMAESFASEYGFDIIKGTDEEYIFSHDNNEIINDENVEQSENQI